jgi:predicted glycoside hydrolase/deacetylase ChbG (UPF0249 family)
MPRFEQQESDTLARRLLIVNADDFGRHAAINEGIVRTVEHGIVTSASLMVRWPAAVAAAVYSRRNRRLSVGLHLDLGEWEYRDGGWQTVYEVVSLDDHASVAREVAHQLDVFRDLVGRDPTHLDSHQHVHRHEPVRTVMRDFARRLDVPLRQDYGGIRYCGDFYGHGDRGGAGFPDAITVEALARILRSLEVGVTELACHPGNGADGCSTYDAQRQVEVTVLCDPRLREILEVQQIELTGFGDLRKSRVIEDRTIESVSKL